MLGIKDLKILRFRKLLNYKISKALKPDLTTLKVRLNKITSFIYTVNKFETSILTSLNQLQTTK